MDAGNVTNVAIANNGAIFSNEATETVTSTQQPQLTLTKVGGPSTYSQVGQVITYSYTITNTGNVTITGPFSVTDTHATVTVTQPTGNTLTSGQSTTGTATYTITQLNLDAGNVTNVAIANSGTIFSNQATETVTSTQLIQITKLQRNVSRGDSFTDMTITAYANQTVEYSLTVKNTGANPVYDVIIADVLLNELSFVSAVSVPIGTLIHSGSSTNGVVTWSFSPLDPGDLVTAVFSVTIPVQSEVPIENLASGGFAVKPEGPRFQTIDSNVVILLDPPVPSIQITGYSCATIFTRCAKDNECKPCKNKQC